MAAKEYFEKDFVEKLGGGKGAKVLGQYFYTNIEPRPDGTADWRFLKKAILSSLIKGHFQPRWEIIRDLKMPTLFIRGERSEDFPRPEFEKVLQTNSKIEGVEIANSGHWVHFDQPQAFQDAVLTFLRRIVKT
jgi:esterase